MENVDNRFELVLVASKRARQLANGAESELEWENDKPTVLALREIAENKVNASILVDKPASLIDENALLGDQDAASSATQSDWSTTTS